MIFLYYHRLLVNIKIWESTPNSLIDFEVDHNKNFSIIVKSKGTLYQIGDSLRLFPSKEEYKKNIENLQNRQKFLCNITLNRDLYDIEMTEEEQKETASINNNDIFNNNNNLDIDNIPWIISKYVFENNQEHGYKLHKGDIFKLGKYILRVREIGIEDDKKHFIFENKNTQKYIKNRSISVNNLSQIPLNQQGENYFSALNLNQIINVQRKDNNNENKKENNENSQNNNEEENGSNNNRNIQIIKKESENNENSNSHSNNSNNENSNGNNKLNNRDNNNFVSIIHTNQKNNEKSEGNNENHNLNNNSQRVISIYYSNHSGNNNNQSQNYNEIISNNGSNNNENNNGNHFFINIINSSNVENNNILDDSKNKINNNSLGFNTFHNNSIINSSCNNSGKNISNCINNSSFKNNENEINKNINLNNNNNYNNNCQIIKSSFLALKSTASFRKKKLTDIIPNKNFKNSGSVSEKNSKPICRICLSEEYEENNPLIHPCNCDGTMKYIHLQCLKLLIQSKIKKTETESCKVFTFKTLECEICKMVFPEKIRIKGSIFSIIDFEKPDKDYIILDGLIKEMPEEKSIFIVHFKNKKEIKIGRATDANIRLSDISVSRAHAIISQYNDSFYLHDTNSKFGTLISAGNKFCILYNKSFSVQKGNILFEFLMKKTLCATLRCYHPSVVLYKTYNDFLDETFLYKNQYKEEELLIPEKTKTVSEYSSNAIIKPNQIKVKSSKNIDFFDDSNKYNNDINNNIKKNNDSSHSKEDNKNSSSLSNNNSNCNEDNCKSNNSNNDGYNNNNQLNMFESFKIDKDKENNHVGNYQSIGGNKTQEISNIYQKNEIMKSNSKNGISLDNNVNENSLLVNNVNNCNDKV